MKTYHIYHKGRHLDTIYAYNKGGAVIHFLDDNPEYEWSNLEVIEVFVP